MAEVDFKTGPSLADDSKALARDYESISVGRQFQSGQRLVQVLARPPFAAYPRPRGDITFRVDERELRDLLEAAGFEVTSIGLYDSPYVYASAEAVVRFSEASSFGNLLNHLPRELRPAARQAIARELAPLAAADGTIPQDGRRMIAIGVRKK
jgi:hypothetical protein